MLKIYGTPISVHTRKVIVVTKIKGLPYELVPVVPVIPGNAPANWCELSPTGMIPALQDGDFTVADSTAICTYVDKSNPQNPVYPKSPQESARVLSLEAYAEERLFCGVVRTLFHEIFVHPKIQKRPTDTAVVDRILTTTLPEVFGYLDRAASGGVLVGESISVADIAVVSNLVTFMYCGFDLRRDSYPLLSRLFDRVVAHRAVREALSEELPVVKSMGLSSELLVRLAA